MIGELVRFDYDCRCVLEIPGDGSIPAMIKFGNVGIIISKYIADPTLHLSKYEVLVGDQIYCEIDDDVFSFQP